MGTPQSYWKGWAGPGSGGQQVLTANEIPGNKWVDQIGFRMYDTTRFVAGSAIPETPRELFQVPVGQMTDGGNFPTQYKKNLFDTNVKTAGLIPKDNFFIVQSLQVKVVISGAIATTYASSGDAFSMPTDPTQAGAVASVNLCEAIAEASIYSFRVQSKTYEQGTGDLFPSAYGITGFAGGGSENNFESVSNNGRLVPYRFPIPRFIGQLADLAVTQQFGYEFTPQANFRIKVILDGLLARPVQ